MKLTVSNIAWSVEEEDAVARDLREWGAAGVEVAPTRIWPDLSQAPAREVAAYRAFWEDHGLRVSSMQALLYGQPELRIFEGPEVRDATLAYLEHALEIGAILGAGVLVFGSPKNRQRGDLDPEPAHAVALEFFRRLGVRAQAHGVAIGLEANPTDYQCDFLTTHGELSAFVRAVDHPGVAHHLDLGGALLCGDDEAEAVAGGWPLSHVHLSEPFLNGIGRHPEAHDRLAHALRAKGYSGWISIESRRDEADALGRVEQAVAFVTERYLGGNPAGNPDS